MLGKTTKLVLPYEQITKLYKSTSKVYKSIKVHKLGGNKRSLKASQSDLNNETNNGEAEKDTVYRFYSFSDRDFTFKYIRRLWANASTHAGSDDESSQASEEEKSSNVKEA